MTPHSSILAWRIPWTQNLDSIKEDIKPKQRISYLKKTKTTSRKPVKEKDNFDEVEVTAKVARKDKDGKRVKEVVDGKKVTVYDEVKKTIKKDQPSRLHARRQMNKVLYTVTNNETGKKKDAKKVDLTNKLFEEIAPKYADRKGGYTRIVKIGLRKGDAAMEVLLELV